MATNKITSTQGARLKKDKYFMIEDSDNDDLTVVKAHNEVAAIKKFEAHNSDFFEDMEDYEFDDFFTIREIDFIE